MKWLLSIKRWQYFCFLSLAVILFSVASNYFLKTDELYYASYAEQLTVGQIQELIARSNNISIWTALGYFLLPLVIIIRVLFTSFCLQVGNLMQEYHWEYRQIYNISLKADVVYLLSLVGNFYYYAFFHPANNILDLSINFLSVLKTKGIENVQSWLVLAYNSLNLFELLYVVLLIFLIKSSFQLSYIKSILFVVLTYCIGNYFYIAGMTFIYLNLGM